MNINKRAASRNRSWGRKLISNGDWLGIFGASAEIIPRGNTTRRSMRMSQIFRSSPREANESGSNAFTLVEVRCEFLKSDL